MLKICLVFWESEPQYAYKLYAYKKNMYLVLCCYRNKTDHENNLTLRAFCGVYLKFSLVGDYWLNLFLNHFVDINIKHEKGRY